jgi:hypothetical protein
MRGVSEALTQCVGSAYPTPDAEGYLAAFWPTIEATWDETCRAIVPGDPKQATELHILLARFQRQLEAYGPLFSDAMRSLDRAAARIAKRRGSLPSRDGQRVGDFFAKHRISKSRGGREGGRGGGRGGGGGDGGDDPERKSKVKSDRLRGQSGGRGR